MDSLNPTPKVSVTVVTYNHGEWLRECLESIVTQETDFPFEVIVGDDASTDGITRAVLAEYAALYPQIVKPIFRERNVGGTKNYLDVVSRAQGQYISHIDGDDQMLPGKLQIQVNYLDSHPSSSMVVHNVEVIDGAGEIINKSFLNYEPPETTDLNYLVLNGCYFSHCSKMYRRSSMISKTRPVRTVDFFYHIENAMSGNVGYINKVLGRYRKSRGTASDINSAAYESLHQTYVDAFNRAAELGVKPEIVRRGFLRYQYGLALDYFRSGKLDGFKKRIYLAKEDWIYANWKHKLVFLLREHESIIGALLRLKGAA